jgi:hypothetical protein
MELLIGCEALDSNSMPKLSTTLSDSTDRDLRVQTRRHLRGLIARALVYFSEREIDNLLLVREHLLLVIDSCTSLNKSQNLRSAFALLDKKSREFNQEFRVAIQTIIDEESLLAFPDAPISPERKAHHPDHPLDGMTLSLIDMNEVDRILLIDRVTERFNVHFEPSLTPLTKRLSAMLDLNAPSLSHNPFRPEILVRAFLQAWERCAFDQQATDDLMLSLAPQHTLDLAPLYLELDQVLAHAGIAEQPTLRIKRDEGQPSAHAVSPAPITTEAQHPAVVNKQASTWQALAPAGRIMATQARHFLKRLGIAANHHSTAEVIPTPSQETADESEFVGSLSPEVVQMGLQTMPATDPAFMGYLGSLQAGEVATFSHCVFEGQSPQDRNVLRQMGNKAEVRRAPELDRGTVAALAEVFDYVFADQAIPVQIKFVIGRLQVPVLKAAMIDRDFFLSAEHPARRLVDTLAHASIAWAPEKGEDDPLYTHIQHTVQRVLNEFEDDLELFRDLLQRFNEFLFENEQQTQGRIEPAASQERSGEAYADALAHADKMLHARIKALYKSLSQAKFLVPFLTRPWREVLARAWLTFDTDRQPWESALRTMDQLIWSTQPKTDSEDRRQLVAVLPELVHHLNQGFDAIDWNSQDRALFTRRLITTHTLAIRMTQTASVDTASVALDEREGQQALKELDARLSNQLSASKDEYDRMAQGFKRGMWFDFQEDSDLQHRCRLSWVSPMRTRLLFTNREGFDAFVRSEREVAALLRHGHLRAIDQTPIVARALDHIMASEYEAMAA